MIFPMPSHSIFLHTQHTETDLASSLFPSYPWWLMPCNLPEMSYQNPLFKNHFIEHHWETVPDYSVWKCLSPEMELYSVHSYFGTLIKHCPPYWFCHFLQFPCWTLSTQIRSQQEAMFESFFRLCFSKHLLHAAHVTDTYWAFFEVFHDKNVA